MSSSPEPGGDLVVLDACCLINLLASGRCEEVLRRLPRRWAIARYVLQEEVLEIEAEEGAEEPGCVRDRVALRPLLTALVDRGVLEELDIDSREEEAELVRFAAELDDGEAHTCALALCRGGRVATDDKKAIRTLQSVWESRGHESAAVLRTSQILFPWAEAQRIARPELVRILRAIARRASFIPPKSDPYFERWLELLHWEG